VWLVTAPALAPSTSTSTTWCPASGVIVKLWSAPQLTPTDPLGLIVPFAPADAVIVNVLIAKLAAIVWFACTFVKLKLVTAPTLTPSTSTSSTWKQALGVIVKLWLPPALTDTAPLGLIAPFAPADAVIVNVPAAGRAALAQH